jgi:hypothetical protein
VIPLLVLLASFSSAETAKPVEAGGYLKNVFQYSASAFDGRPYSQNISRARLTLDGRASVFRAHADYDHEVWTGSWFRTADARLSGVGFRDDLDQTISTGTTNHWRHLLYRGHAGIEWEQGLVRFGRQRIAWGTGKIWNPTDVLNPYQPIAVERDQRRGVDAAYLRQGLGDLSQAELAYVLADRWPEAALLGRLRGHFGEYDVAAMGGKVPGSSNTWIVGGDWAGNLWDGTLRGEWSYTDLKGERTYGKLNVGYEYTFPAESKAWVLRDATAMIEYLHNGAGVEDTRRYNVGLLLTGKEIALARDYVGLSYSKDLHALLKLELLLITNCTDGSQFFSPTLDWSVVEDLHVLAGFQRFGGPKRTELGRPANLTFLTAQYWF